jgi:hypothetical protein
VLGHSGGAKVAGDKDVNHVCPCFVLRLFVFDELSVDLLSCSALHHDHILGNGKESNPV